MSNSQNLSLIFDGAFLNLDGETFQVMFLHKGFIFVDMGGDNISFLPLDDSEVAQLLSGIGVDFENIKNQDIIDNLDEHLEGYVHEVELAKIIKN